MEEELRRRPRRWLVTGAAGFIGSNLSESLLKLDQSVVGLDNFSTGRRDNLDDLRNSISAAAWSRFDFVEGDVREMSTCEAVLDGVDYVLHQAAMASVPQSIEEPLACHGNNVTGFVNLLVAVRAAGIKRVVYASSCAVYGDEPELPKSEASPLRCLSPYALTKRLDEEYAEIWTRCYGLETIGLRYFNVFGPRQDPNGAYAAVIPKWIAALMQGQDVMIFGDGESSRDFVHISDVVHANILAATTHNPAAIGQVFNIGAGSRTSLNRLFGVMEKRISQERGSSQRSSPKYLNFRASDIRHSEASIGKAEEFLGYHPHRDFEKNLSETISWYLPHPDRS